MVSSPGPSLVKNVICPQCGHTDNIADQIWEAAAIVTCESRIVAARVSTFIICSHTIHLGKRRAHADNVAPNNNKQTDHFALRGHFRLQEKPQLAEALRPSLSPGPK